MPRTRCAVTVEGYAIRTGRKSGPRKQIRTKTARVRAKKNIPNTECRSEVIYYYSAVDEKSFCVNTTSERNAIIDLIIWPVYGIYEIQIVHRGFGIFQKNRNETCTNTNRFPIRTYLFVQRTRIFGFKSPFYFVWTNLRIPRFGKKQTKIYERPINMNRESSS